MLTYISIFVTAIFVNNIVLSQFLGICPFLGVSKRTGYGCGGNFRHDHSDDSYLFITNLFIDADETGLHANHCFHTGYCRIGPATRNYHQKNSTFPLSDLGRFPAINHYKLHDIGCRIDRYSKKSIASRSYRLCHIDSNRIHIGFGNLCRDA